MKYNLVIFDLDGTTLNTLDDLAAACNHALALNGFPTHSLEKIRLSIGSGIANLIQRVLPDGTDEATHAKVLADFRAYYADHVNDQTAPYPGVIDMLKALRAAGIRVAINSNKINSATNELCKLHFGELVELALGELPDVPRKPAPDGVYRIMSAFGADKAHTLYVGDSGVDLRTAANAGVDGAWVSWGLRHRDELGEGVTVTNGFDSVEDLKAFILA